MHSLELRSLISEDMSVSVSLGGADLPPPGPGEVIVRVEAAPINPSDLSLLLGPVHPESLAASTSSRGSALVGQVNPQAATQLRARIGQSLVVGNEGAGTVVAAGDGAGHLMDRVVSVIGVGGMYAQYRLVPAINCTLLPEGVTARDGAASFVNPMTASCMVETMRRDGCEALINTAAASNLGMMLNRLCLADDIPLLNVVRSTKQAEQLRNGGARLVFDSSQPDFLPALTNAIADHRAMVGFDAIGGGQMAGMLLEAMEIAACRDADAYSRYGSSTFKRVYIYGSLDTGPTELMRKYGFAWSLGGWLLTPFLQMIGAEETSRLRARTLRELTTTFASHYDAEISLAEALDPDIARAYFAKATGTKFLINPAKGH